MYRIYRITNLINNKMYIGLTTTTVNQRWSVHKSEHRSCPLLGRAIKKYGHENFKIEEIYNAFDEESMRIMEAEFIQLNNTMKPNGYNLTCGGEYHITDPSTSKKLSIASKKYWDIQENKKKASERMIEQWNNETLKEKRSSGIKDYVENKKRKVIGVNYTTFECIFFDTVNDMENNGFHSACLYGKAKTTKGYVFYFLENDVDFYINKTKDNFLGYTRGSKSWDDEEKNKARIAKMKESSKERSIRIKAYNTKTDEIIVFDSISDARRYGFSNHGLRKGKQNNWIFIRL